VVCVCVCGVCVCVCVASVCVCGCVRAWECVCVVFFNRFIYQHAPLLMSNTTCIVLNYTNYDLSCLYTFYDIY